MVKETTSMKTVSTPCKTCGGFERYAVTGRCACTWTRRSAVSGDTPREAWRRGNPILAMLHGARGRAVARGTEFSITADDLGPMPIHCPILGIPLVWRVSHSHAMADSPSIDRIDITRGYVPGNVQIISHLANTMKSNATLEQCVLLGVWARGQMVERAVQASRRGPPQA